MKVITGGKVPVKTWCGKPEDSAMEQAMNISNHPAVFRHVALMPDTHSGYGIPIGGVAAFEDVIIPYGIGSDIACGMLACRTDFQADRISEENLLNIIRQIKRDIPMGQNHRNDDINSELFNRKYEDIESIYKKTGAQLKEPLDLKFPDCAESAYKDWEKDTFRNIINQLGTLGSGNHFCELQKDREGFLWIMIHSGSRNIGYRICEYYHKKAKEMCSKWKVSLPTDKLAFLPVDTAEGKEYLNCMNFCIDFSYKNREYMFENIKYAVERYTEESIGYSDIINIHHNYASLENHFGKNVWVHRKGATSAKKNETGIIPGSMGSKSYIVRGKGNRESFMSCSHGAGRCMGRKEAERTFSLNEFRERMKGVVSVDVNTKHIDESPMSYKDISTVMREQSDLVDIIYELTPIANCKG